MLTNPRKNYLGLKRSKFGDEMLDAAARDMVQMKEHGINGDYQYGLYPFPSPNKALTGYYSGFGEGITDIGGTETGPAEDGNGKIYINSSFGMSPELNSHLKQIGIMGDYQYDLFPYPSPNGGLTADVSRFGKKRKKRNTKRKHIGYTFYNKKGYSYYKVYETILKNGKKRKVDNVGRTIRTRVYKTKITAEKESKRRAKRMNVDKRQKFRV